MHMLLYFELILVLARDFVPVFPKPAGSGLQQYWLLYQADCYTSLFDVNESVNPSEP